LPDSIPIQINGESRTVPPGLTLAGLLAYLDIAAGRVAIERNRTIVRQPDWASTPVEPGDQIEIVQFVGGGCRP
jgi:thiamine biosynthesis protein ThiS